MGRRAHGRALSALRGIVPAVPDEFTSLVPQLVPGPRLSNQPRILTMAAVRTDFDSAVTKEASREQDIWIGSNSEVAGLHGGICFAMDFDRLLDRAEITRSAHARVE
jgi:hypothetical protein